MEWLNTRNIEQFNGTRYGTWKFRIKTVLEELRVSSVIEESPPENPNVEWTEKNSVAKCTIVNFLGDAFLHLAEGSVTAKSIIDNLDKLYEKRGLGTQLALRTQLFNLKLLSNVSLLQHFTIFDTLVAKLICAGANLDEMDKICHLLLTLPFSYEKVIESLEVLHEEHFDLAFIKTVLLDYEAKMEIEAINKLKECCATQEIPHNPRSKRKTNTTTNGPNKRRKPNNYHQNKSNYYRSLFNSRMYCDYCGRQNHYIQDCHFYNRQYDHGFNNNRYLNSSKLPQFASKVKRKLQKTKLHSAQSSTNLTIKEEPVSIKQEPIEIKEEPVWIKQEPVWVQSEPIVVKTEPGDGQQRINVGVVPNSNEGLKSRRNCKKRTSTEVIVMHIRAEKAAQAHENQQGPSVHN